MVRKQDGNGVCTACCLGNPIGPEWALNFWSDEATSFALQMGKAIDGVLYSRVTVYRAVKKAMQLSVCSG